MKRALGIILLLTALPLWAALPVWAIEIETPLGRDVRGRVSEIPHLGAHDIAIHHRAGGVITLEGSVASELDRERIEAVARTTPGVSLVRNRLTITAPTEGMASLAAPASVASDIRARLRGAPNLHDFNLEISVLAGVATLRGEARDEADRRRIEEITRSTPGVMSIENRITTRAPRSDEELVREVQEALARNPEISLRDLNIRADHGVVTFEGARARHAEVDQILSTALMVEGVRDIRSEMTVGGHAYPRPAAP